MNPPAATDAITVSGDSLIFFNDQDLSIAQDNPYAVMITGTAGSQSAMTQFPGLFVTISNPCKDTNFVTLNSVVMSD